MKNLVKIILIVLLMSLTIKSNPAWSQFFFFEEDITGEQAPDFTLETLENGKVNFTEFRDGQQAIIFFWATWCPHCREQLRELTRDKQDFVDKGIKLVLVDLGENEKIVRKYIKKNKIDFTIFLDKESELSDPYGIIGLPTFYFVNEEGGVTAIEHALPDNYEELLTKEGI